MPSRTPRPGASRPGTPASDSIRPGLAIGAALAIATALAAVGFSLHAVLDGDGGGDDEPPSSARRATVAGVQPAAQPQQVQPFAGSSFVRRGGAARSPRDDRASAGAAAARSEDVPEWDGQGKPSRAWVEHWITQWFEQNRPEATPAPRELMHVVDLAIELDEIRLEIQEVTASTGDADLVARLEERARLVQEDLLSITEIGGAEIPRY